MKVFNESGVNFFVHDTKLHLPDLVRTKFVINMKPGIDKEVKFSKTVISAISRPPEKLCSVDTIGPETCITNYVSSLHLFLNVPQDIQLYFNSSCTYDLMVAMYAGL